MATSGRPSAVLVLILLIAIALGAAASLLIGAATSHGATPGVATLVTIPNWLLADTLLGAGVAAIGALLYYRFSGTTLPIPGRMVVFGLVLFLLAILFIAAYHTLVVGGPAQTGGVSGGKGNTTGNSTGGGATNSTKNGTLVHGSGGILWSPSLPSWLPFVIIVGIVLVVVAVAVPQVRRILEDRGSSGAPRRPPPRSLMAVKGALEQAEQDLARGGDARTVILALYGAVLERLTTMVGSVDVETPEEIRLNHLLRLGIRARAAEELTRLFEEARYSSHPLDDTAAETARRAVRAALDDLSRSTVASS